MTDKLQVWRFGVKTHTRSDLGVMEPWEFAATVRDEAQGMGLPRGIAHTLSLTAGHVAAHLDPTRLNVFSLGERYTYELEDATHIRDLDNDSED